MLVPRSGSTPHTISGTNYYTYSSRLYTKKSWFLCFNQ